MTEPNGILPQNLQDLIANLSTVQAVPLGTQQGIPFLALKTAAGNERLFEDDAVTCEFKPSVFNVDYKGQTLALCIVQLRLNGSDRLIYTCTYDLHNDKQYSDCHDLLAMRQYGLLIATETLHTFLQFDTEFAGAFNPQQVLNEARSLATDYDPLLFSEVVYGLTMQADTPAHLWAYLDELAPALHRWYARFALQAEKVE